MNTHHESYSRKNQRLDEDLRAVVLSAMSELGLKQEDLADALRVDQSLIHHWFSYNGNHRFPAAYLPLLNTPETLPLRYRIIEFLCDNSPIEVTQKQTNIQTNGTIDDEIARIVRELGIIKAQVERDPMKKVSITAHVLRLEAEISSIKEELRRM
jgi:hypothetical protein